MAVEFPEATFLGIDLSARQIADGQKLVDELGLSNIRLRHQNIADVSEADGQFDYIICHGVYSWVPRIVQDRILEIGVRNLKPDGLCYVSYNTYPGWHLRGTVRDMMRYHVATIDAPEAQIQQARTLLEFLNRSTTPRSEAYRRLLSEEAAILNRHSDSYLFHEHLEDINAPLYFHEFLDRASAAGLQYLADADFGSMIADRLDDESAAALRDVSFIQQEQYMDFLRNRMFRSSVLCHADAAVDRNIHVSRLAGCHFSLDARLDLTDAELATTKPLEVTVRGEKVTTGDPVMKAALLTLDALWPEYLSFDVLFQHAIDRAKAAGAALDDTKPAEQREALCADLMVMLTHGLLQLRINPPRLTAKAGSFPATTPLVRLQARDGNVVTNRRHQMMELAELPRALLVQLDGHQDRASLKRWLATAIGHGEFQVHRNGRRIDNVDDSTVEQLLTDNLELLAENALLVPNP